MTPFVWGLLIGFVGSHILYFVWFAIVWYRTILKDHREPQQVHDDFERIRRVLTSKGQEQAGRN